MRAKLGMIAFLSASLLAGFANAEGGGSEAGNGGSSIVCQDPQGQITSVELLDFYEARTQRGIKVHLGPATDSVDTKLALLVQRFARLDTKMAARLEYDIKLFSSDSHFYSGVRLVEIPDSQNLFIPSGCQQEQIAIWRRPTVPEDRLYNINQDLWDRLDNDNRAGLIWHELLYHVVKLESQSETLDSRMVRYLVSKLASTEGASWDLHSYVDVLRQLHFPYINYGNYAFAISELSPSFSDSGEFAGGDLAETGRIAIQGQNISIKAMDFNKDGTIWSIMPLGPVLLTAGGQDVWFEPNQKIYFEKGNVSSGHAMAGNKNNFKKPGFYDLTLKAVDKNPIQISFAADGTLKLCMACQGVVTFADQNISVDVPTPFKMDDYWNVSYYTDGHDFFEAFLATPTKFKTGGREILLSGSLWGNPKTGEIQRANLAEVTAFTIRNQQVWIAPGLVLLYSSGQLETGRLVENTVLTSAAGKNIQYLAGMALTFSIDGFVMQVESSSRQKRKLRPGGGDLSLH